MPVQVPLAPCQLPDRNLNRFPVASTMYRPRVLNGGVHASAAATACGAACGLRGTGAGGEGASAATIAGITNDRTVK
ncbi:hypothetical protein KRMM14A1259_52690 [Krasilnikovia sp. MM14-A1259]